MANNLMRTGDAPKVAEDIFRENGRLYQGPRHARKYFLPVADKAESDRLDMFHQFFKIVFQDKIHTAATVTSPESRVLDIGCGTGIFTIQVSQELDLEKGLAVGVDVTMAQPELMPRNAKFVQGDVEQCWSGELSGCGPYDSIFCRMMRGAIRNWPAVFANVFSNLTPGTGVFEHVEIDWCFQKVEGLPMPNLQKWSTEVAAGFQHLGIPIRVDPNLVQQQLHEAGFEDITMTPETVALSTWPDDLHGRQMGRWFNLVALQSIFPLVLAPMYHRQLASLGGERAPQGIKDKLFEEIEDLAGDVQKDLHTHAGTVDVYCNLYIFTARRPAR